jgi:hypothetical protein
MHVKRQRLLDAAMYNLIFYSAMKNVGAMGRVTPLKWKPKRPLQELQEAHAAALEMSPAQRRENVRRLRAIIAQLTKRMEQGK